MDGRFNVVVALSEPGILSAERSHENTLDSCAEKVNIQAQIKINRIGSVSFFRRLYLCCTLTM